MTMRLLALTLFTLISLQSTAQTTRKLPPKVAMAFNQFMKDYSFEPLDKQPFKIIPNGQDTVYFIKFENFTSIPFDNHLSFFFLSHASGKDSIRVFFSFRMDNMDKPAFKPFDNSYLQNTIKNCNITTPYKNKYAEIEYHFSYDGSYSLIFAEVKHYDIKLKKKYDAKCIRTEMTEGDFDFIEKLEKGVFEVD